LVTAIIPGVATLVAWILVVLGKAKDYKDNDGNEESDFIS
jgi:hypothetical protein